jgi:hypothetical protein
MAKGTTVGKITRKPGKRYMVDKAGHVKETTIAHGKKKSAAPKKKAATKPQKKATPRKSTAKKKTTVKRK